MAHLRYVHVVSLQVFISPERLSKSKIQTHLHSENCMYFWMLFPVASLKQLSVSFLQDPSTAAWFLLLQLLFCSIIDRVVLICEVGIALSAQFCVYKWADIWTYWQTEHLACACPRTGYSCSSVCCQSIFQALLFIFPLIWRSISC